MGKVKLNETFFMEYSLEKNLFEINDLIVIELNEYYISKDENSFLERDFLLYLI